MVAIRSTQLGPITIKEAMEDSPGCGSTLSLPVELRSMGSEQIPLSRLVDIAYESFDKTMRSTRAKVLMLGAFTTEDAAVEAFLRSRNRKDLLDRRKCLGAEEAAYLNRVREYASDTADYVEWLRKSDGAHAFNESLVSYCSALENCLKGIAIAFRLAGACFKTQVYVPSEKYGRVRNGIMKDWDQKFDGEVRVQAFFDKYINEACPTDASYSLPHVVDPEVWQGCDAAFRLRNSIVHNVGRVSESVDFESWRFIAGDHVQLPELMLARVRINFERIVHPFCIADLGF